MLKIEINKGQTDFIKGLGILLIVFHNYFHWVTPNPGENEFIFEAQNIRNVFSILSDSYLNIVNVLFSFFGHYGVQLFIFICSYGLAKSFISKPQNFATFIKRRAWKIYPAFFISILVLFIYNALVCSTLPSMGWCASITYKVLMLHTLLPGKALLINGPWWFYGLIMQLYFLFIPVLYVIKKFRWKGLIFVIIISYVLIHWLYTPLLNSKIFIMANAPGHIPEFALGILLALYPKLTIKTWCLPVLISIFILGNFSFYFFPFTFITITYLLIIGIQHFFREKYKNLTVVNYYGQISMYLFAVHGFFRRPYFIQWAETSNNVVMVIAIGILYLLTVTIVAHCCREFHALINKELTRGKYYMALHNIL